LELFQLIFSISEVFLRVFYEPCVPRDRAFKFLLKDLLHAEWGHFSCDFVCVFGHIIHLILQIVLKGLQSLVLDMTFSFLELFLSVD
jgi:hypothetical protein